MCKAVAIAQAESGSRNPKRLYEDRLYWIRIRKGLLCQMNPATSQQEAGTTDTRMIGNRITTPSRTCSGNSHAIMNVWWAVDGLAITAALGVWMHVSRCELEKKGAANRSQQPLVINISVFSVSWSHRSIINPDIINQTRPEGAGFSALASANL